jgi:ABC-type branched-subunit amino acid transport system substrate-binding protein
MDKRIMAGAIIVVIAVVGVAGVLVFFPPEVQPIKIGAISPLTGGAAPGGGIPVHDGIILAAEQRETVLGRPIEIVYGDGFDGPAGASEAERLITVEGVQVITGSYSISAVTASEKCDEYNIPFLDTTQWNDENSARGLEYYFRTCAKSSTYARTFADQVLDFWIPELNETTETFRYVFVGD